ncbi:hypothetical protein [Microbacterium sp. 179-I 3D4 NHS]|uniref:hypothetical protein n=1 Tax=Microbacterium sp. 179-I 3D4 NHS TaxID=3142381 RepID=UPI0039A075E2
MTRVWVRELAGWMLASAVALLTAATVASSARAELLFRDGDSLIVALLSRSVLSGEPLDWAMSSVLFVPETAVFVALDALVPLEADGLLALTAVLNLLGLYGALRLTAGRRSEGFAPVAWSVVALGVVGLLAMTESSASRDALEPASLQLMTTYYSATVIGVVMTIGVLRRALDRAKSATVLAVALAVIAVISAFSNPLYAAWATVPLSVLLAIFSFCSEHRKRAGVLLGILILASAGGLLLRIPFAAWIANTGAGYAQPERWRESMATYGGLLAERLSTPLGVLAALVLLALLGLAAWSTSRATEAGSRFVATAAWLVPVLVVIGAIALGTHASRYLQPIAFAPVLALLAVPRAWALPPSFRRSLAVIVGLAVLVGGAFSIPRLAAAAQRPDADLACVTDWVDTAGRTGAGQFWTVRLPKLHLDDPAQLVQVDHRLQGYAWLVNRTDFDAAAVSFLIEDAQTVPWDLPVAAVPDDVVDCGRYRIVDFGDALLPLGPAHS